MNQLPRLLAFLGLMIAVAAASAVVCLWMTPRIHKSEPRTHDWVHSRLKLSPEQERALKPIEARYAVQRSRLERNLHLANVALADAIQRDRGESENVLHAIEEIHARMGELQKVTIGHIFEMQDVLTPEQYDALLRMTAEALGEGDQNSNVHGHE